MKHSIETVRHSLAHILAMAILRHDPEAKLGTGPATDDGFFYDVLLSGGKTLTPDDFESLIEDMRAIIREDLPFERRVITATEARELFANNLFKLEIVAEAEERGEEISVYTCGDFTDLCAGPHVEKTGDIDAQSFAMKGLAGAYWRGDEENPMFVRVSGYAFPDKKALKAHLVMLEEAKKRDHRKLGKELKLFTSSPLVGAGLPLIQPNGMIIRQEIESLLWRLHRNKGYSRIWTPHIAKESLYETSGHAEKFGDELFRVRGKEEQFIMKPMSCPHHMQIFADNQFSYRDMPIRYFEPATVYRDEKSGELGGLTRVRSITQDDGHLFCRVSQIQEEVSQIVGIIREFYTIFDMMDGYWVSLSVRDEERDRYLGSEEVWEAAETALERAAEENELQYQCVEGEATFYGPKLDFMFKDAIGREWQLATIQCDFNLPERFDLSFTNEKGEAERPVVIHRAISGSLERFMGIMIEHFAGAFPFWLAPVQVRVLPIGEAHRDYAREVVTRLRDADIRVEIDDSDESLGKKIRNVKTEKIPYFLVIGDAEVESGTVMLESRDEGKIGEQSQGDLIERFSRESSPETNS